MQTKRRYFSGNLKLIYLSSAFALMFTPGAGLLAETIDCGTKGNAIPGAAGASRIVTCPAGCTSGSVWGSAIYTDDSAVCTAAIHAGLLTASGGKVRVIIGGAKPRFLGLTQRGITSSPYGAWTRSISFMSPPSSASGGSSSGASSWRRIVFPWGILLVIGIVFLLYMRGRKKQREGLAKVFAELAGALGLEHERPAKSRAGRVSGTYQGHEVLVQTYKHSPGGGNPATTYLQVQTAMAEPILKGMRIFPNTTLKNLGASADRLGGEKKIQTGNGDFDNTVYAGAEDDSKASVLTPAVQQAMIDYFEQASDWDLFLSGANIKASRTITMQSRGQLENLLKLQGAVAAALTGTAG